jgi:uncharacterized protein (DUF2267 family)
MATMPTMIDEDGLIARIAEDTGTPDLDVARRGLDATLTVIAAALDRVEAEVLAGDLPARLARLVRDAERGVPPWTEDPIADVAQRARIGRGLALELAHTAGHRLAERLDPDVLRLLVRRLPAPWPELLHHRVSEPSAPAVHHAPVTGEGHTLASGRPGSSHAVADHGVETAHADSVARTDNPHGDEKLSSGAPAGEPVATEHPRTKRGIAEADG